jgi:HEAT repeat protein
MTSSRWILAAAMSTGLILATGGCTPGGSAAQGQKVMRQPKAPPPVPPVKAEARDAQLASTAVQELLRQTKSESPLLRAHALEAIKMADVRAGYPAILAGMQDQAGLVRYAACLAAGELRLPETAAGATALLTDSRESVRIAAIYTLHRLGDTQYSHTLEKTAVSPEMHTRANTAMVLGLLGEQSGEKILTVMLHDPSPSVRLQAAEAMWRLRDRESLEYLVTATVSPYPDDQIIAALALAAPREREVIEHLRGMLVTRYPEVNLAAARGLGMLGSDEGYGTAHELRGSADPRQRQLAALAFGAIGRMDAQGDLRKLLVDADPDVRIAAAGAILQLK